MIQISANERISSYCTGTTKCRSGVKLQGEESRLRRIFSTFSGFKSISSSESGLRPSRRAITSMTDFSPACFCSAAAESSCCPPEKYWLRYSTNWSRACSPRSCERTIAVDSWMNMGLSL